KESIEDCADRLEWLLLALSKCDLAFATWYARGAARKEAQREVAYPSDRAHLLSLLDKGRNRRDIDRAAIPHLGFRIGLWNGGDRDHQAGLGITCGMHAAAASGPRPALANSVVLDLPSALGALQQVEPMSAVLAALAKAWEPAWAGVMSRSAMTERKL